MPLKEFSIDSEGIKKEKLVCISVENKLYYVSITEAGAIANNIITQLQIIGIQNVSETGTDKHKTDITRKEGFGT